MRLLHLTLLTITQGETSRLRRGLTSIARQLAPPEAVEACASIGRALEALENRRGRKHRRRGPLVLDLLLLRALDKDCERGTKIQIKDPSFLRFAWRHASAAYGYVLLKACGLLPGVHIRSSIQRLDELGIRERCGDVDVFFENFRDKKTLDGTPKCYVCRDGDRVVLSIRGTADIFDALTDVLCEAVPFLNGEAHSGMLKAADRCLAATEASILEALDSAPRKCDLVITGHSMGGGCAILAAMRLDELRRRHDAKGPGSRLADRLYKGQHHIRCVAFSPPPVATVACRASRRCSLASVCRGEDVVPSLSLRSVANLLRSLDVLDASLEVGRRARLVALDTVKTDAVDEVRSKLGAQLSRLRDDFHGDDHPARLVVPGGLVRLGQEHHVFDDKPPVIRVRDASVSDHTLMSVDASIEALAEHYVVD
ncbi:unnamed protein product [Pelagomonas calceolata]|uniref:sn-1-specific diacylglycerol lipase n=1 Tax=Pelagomonas calceolata TaxID=35677 RepID=A0A8J2T209_9STRA|nr:unnamed protein product [Pelagomonas calceolata]